MMGIHVNPIRSRALSPDYPENPDKMAASLEKQRGLKIIPNYFVLTFHFIKVKLLKIIATFLTSCFWPGRALCVVKQ